MISPNEIKNKLLIELKDKIDNIKTKTPHDYYNEILGNVSIYIVGILESHLDEEQNSGEEEWLDDAILTNFKKYENEILIEGLIIYGKVGTTQQWVAPFIMILKMDNTNSFKEYILLYKSNIKKSIDYDIYIKDRYDYENGIDQIKDWIYMFSGCLTSDNG